MNEINIKGPIVDNDEKWIYDFFGISCVSPKSVIDEMKKANGEKLDVYINSSGGSIFAGSEIYSALRAYEGEVKIHVVGIAASAASVIACAGKSDISPTGMIMVHNVSAQSSGDYHQMDKTSDVLKKANETIANAYIQKTGMSMEEALSMMDKETWLTADDAVSNGLIDEVSGSKNLQLVASFNSGLIPREIIAKMQNERMKNNTFSLSNAKIKLKYLKLKGEL